MWRRRRRREIKIVVVEQEMEAVVRKLGYCISVEIKVYLSVNVCVSDT